MPETTEGQTAEASSQEATEAAQPVVATTATTEAPEASTESTPVVDEARNRLDQTMAFLAEHGRKKLPDPDGDNDDDAEEAPVAEASETTEEESTPVTAEEETAAETETETPAAEETAEPGFELPERIRTGRWTQGSEFDKAVLATAINKNLSLDEARAEILKQQGLTTAPPPEKAAETKEPTIAELEAQLDAIDNDIAEAVESLEGKKVASLQKQQREILKTISQREQSEARNASEQQSEQQRVVSESYQRVLDGLPDSAKVKGADGSIALAPDVKAVLDAEVKSANPSIFQNPNWPELLAGKALLSGKIKLNGAARPAVAAKPAVTAPPKLANGVKPPAARAAPAPASGSATASSASPAARTTAIQKEYQQAKAAGPRALTAYLARYGNKSVGDADED
jgi:hypothetical protein